MCIRDRLTAALDAQPALAAAAAADGAAAAALEETFDRAAAAPNLFAQPKLAGELIAAQVRRESQIK